jgi:GrpB-like predicted nucleotidyltransferase (UPF0157 family)
MSVGEGAARKPGAIVLRDHDPAWPAAYGEIRRRLERLLDGLVQETCHIGSTSVPGLAAKPKIDVDIVLRSEAVIPEGIERLKAAGYVYHGNRYQDGMWVFTLGRGCYGERLYLCAPGTPTHLRRLLFRDHLRRRPEAAAAYAALKRSLAAEAIDDWDHYTSGKGPFVAGIVRQAAAAGVQEVTAGRGRIAADVLHDLPAWFGIPAATDAYIAAAETLPMLASRAPDGSPLGFVSIRPTSGFAAEIHVMGVRKAWHRCGLGRALIGKAKERARGQGARFLTVKTLSPSKPDESYAATRRFYEAVGFLPIEEFPTLWGAGNPCLLMLCPLAVQGGCE